jgi:hypothetical protein
MSPKKLGVTGLFIAFVIALPLFVWSAINVNFNVNKRAQGEPNFCGGTCGSNYNCQANFFCFEGYCRNPICSSSVDCICSTTTPTPIITATPIKLATITPKPTVSATPSITPVATVSATPESINEIIPIVTNTPTTGVENMFFAKYAIYIFLAFVLIIILSIYFAIKKNKNIPHILPPTNI